MRPRRVDPLVLIAALTIAGLTAALTGYVVLRLATDGEDTYHRDGD